MIRALAALTRQVQECFHIHLAGICRWEDVVYMPRKRVERTPASSWPRNRRGGLIRPDFPEGKYHVHLHLQFGIWDLKVDGPTERPPLGWVTLQGHDTIEGPLAPETWKAIAEHIKQKSTELEHVA